MSGLIAAGTQVAGHFGEWVQGKLGPDGPIALITVACDVLCVTATADTGAPFELLQPDGPILSQDQAATFLRTLGHPVQGRFVLRADMPPGGGAGASTAALVALARALGCDESMLPRACLAVEGATDPLMLAHPDQTLWLSRQAEPEDKLPELPQFEIVGGFWGAELPTDGADAAFPDIADLIPFWRHAAAQKDRAALAGIATESARRTTKLRGPEADPTRDLAAECGALGIIRAHTGSARGLLFAPGAAPTHVAAQLQEAGFKHILRFQTGGAG